MLLGELAASPIPRIVMVLVWMPRNLWPSGRNPYETTRRTINRSKIGPLSVAGMGPVSPPRLARRQRDNRSHPLLCCTID
jgi:hypothetical protein